MTSVILYRAQDEMGIYDHSSRQVDQGELSPPADPAMQGVRRPGGKTSCLKIFVSTRNDGLFCKFLLFEENAERSIQICFSYLQALATAQPPYLHSLISVQPARATRSSSVVTLSRPPTSSSLKITNRSFRYASPHLCNQLPVSSVSLA